MNMADIEAKKESFIRDYSSIRRILRNHYIYGFYTKKDYENFGIKSRTYEKYQKKINYLLPDNFLKDKKQNKRVIHFCEYDMYENTQNDIVNTFRAKNFVSQDIKVYFYCLQMLNKSIGREMGLSEFVKGAPDASDKNFSKQNIDPNIKELIKYGYIIYNKERKKYRLRDDIFEELTDEELEDIYTLLEMVKDHISFEVPFFFLQNKLGLYMSSDRGKDDVLTDFFLSKHSHLFNVVDDEIVYKILKCISKQSNALITINSKNGKQNITTVPVKIIHDVFYGRQYLLSYSEEYNNFSTYRIDTIEDVKEGLKLDDDKFNKILEASSVEELCWCTSAVSSEKETLVKIEFSFDEDKEFFILDRIKREGSNGIITKIEGGRYLYEISVKDPKEMIPWIRSFGERARVIESGKFKIEEQILSDWKELLEKYGAI